MYIYDRIILTFNVRIFSLARRFTFWCGLLSSTTKASSSSSSCTRHTFFKLMFSEIHQSAGNLFIYLFILTHSSGALPTFFRFLFFFFFAAHFLCLCRPVSTHARRSISNSKIYIYYIRRCTTTAALSQRMLVRQSRGLEFHARWLLLINWLSMAGKSRILDFT